MSEEVNKIIDNICMKLGTSAQFLIPEMAKMKVAELTVAVIATSIVLILTIFAIKKIIKHAEGWDVDLLLFFPGIILIIEAVFLMSFLYDLAGWVASPTAKAVIEIVHMLK